MSLLKTDPESGVYLGQDKPSSDEIQYSCEIDRMGKKVIELQDIIGQKIRHLLFELKKIFG